MESAEHRTTEFHRSLLRDKTARYPAAEIERACSAAGLPGT